MEQKIFQEDSKVLTMIRLRPFIRELAADLETPVSVYLKLVSHGPSFLLESVSGGEHVARYSFIGLNPTKAYLFRGRSLEIVSTDGRQEHNLNASEDPLSVLKSELDRYQVIDGEELPRFAGGFVGYENDAGASKLKMLYVPIRWGKKAEPSAD